MSFPPFNRGAEYGRVDRDYLNRLRDEREALLRALVALDNVFDFATPLENYTKWPTSQTDFNDACRLAAEALAKVRR